MRLFAARLTKLILGVLRWRAFHYYVHSRNSLVLPPLGFGFSILVCISHSGEAFAKSELWNRCVDADIDARIVSCSQFIARGKRETKSNQIAAYISRASGYRANGDYDRALADLDKALRTRSEIGASASERASIYDVKSEFDRAIADYDTVLKLDKDSLAVRSGRARAYRARESSTRRLPISMKP